MHEGLVHTFKHEGAGHAWWQVERLADRCAGAAAPLRPSAPGQEGAPGMLHAAGMTDICPGPTGSRSRGIFPLRFTFALQLPISAPLMELSRKSQHKHAHCWGSWAAQPRG